MTPHSDTRLRPCTAHDLNFAKEVHFESLREAITLSSGWDDEEQARFVNRWFKPERIQIIQQDLRDIGFLVLERAKDRFFLESISLVPEYRNQGIGELLLKGIMSEASKARLPITLLVLKTNRARKFYDSLEFKQIFEDRTHFHMKWKAS